MDGSKFTTVSIRDKNFTRATVVRRRVQLGGVCGAAGLASQATSCRSPFTPSII